MKSFLSNITSKFIPKDYEDYIGVPRSIISFNSIFLKSDNVVSFNPQNINEVFILYFYLGVLFYK
jgi:hypothetical protein